MCSQSHLPAPAWTLSCDPPWPLHSLLPITCVTAAALSAPCMDPPPLPTLPWVVAFEAAQAPVPQEGPSPSMFHLFSLPGCPGQGQWGGPLRSWARAGAAAYTHRSSCCAAVVSSVSSSSVFSASSSSLRSRFCFSALFRDAFSDSKSSCSSAICACSSRTTLSALFLCSVSSSPLWKHQP